jgi:hypothetical protein
MRLMRMHVLAAALTFLGAEVAGAQLTMGAGGGTGTGSRGGDAPGGHAMAFLEVRVPMFTGVRADAMLHDAPGDGGKWSVAVSAVLSASIPVVTPYVLGGWGRYGMGDGASRGGWNYGAGARLSLGVPLFIEFRRHQRIARDLVTIGVTF